MAYNIRILFIIFEFEYVCMSTYSIPFLQGNIKYPVNKLKGTDIKTTVYTRLVDPVCASGDYAVSFRVVWRVNTDLLAGAWDAIVAQRRRCDRIVAQTTALQMFVSSITGVFEGRGDDAGDATRLPGRVIISTLVPGSGRFQLTNLLGFS